MPSLTPWLRRALVSYAWFSALCAGGVMAQPTDPEAPEAEELYQRFLEIYRRESPTRAELRSALILLESADAATPGTYKYVFGLGALNIALRDWEAACDWLEAARSLTHAGDQRQLIESELVYSRAQLAKQRDADASSEGMSVLFEMKTGSFELRRDIADRLPQRLPMVHALEPTDSLKELLRESLGEFEPDMLAWGPFLIAGLDHDASADEHFRKGVNRYYDYLMREYFEDPPQRILVIVVASRPFRLVAATRALYPHVDLPLYAPFLGYYNRADNLIMATGGPAGYGTLLHELVHALVEADFQRAPPWLDEGLASLHERTRWAAGRLQALPNWRMEHLRECCVARPLSG